MHSELCSLWVTGNVDFPQLLETAQTIGFIMLSVSVAYSARFGLPRCVAKFEDSGAQENWISQELWGTPQIFSFSVRSLILGQCVAQRRFLMVGERVAPNVSKH